MLIEICKILIENLANVIMMYVKEKFDDELSKSSIFESAIDD